MSWRADKAVKITAKRGTIKRTNHRPHRTNRTGVHRQPTESKRHKGHSLEGLSGDFTAHRQRLASGCACCRQIPEQRQGRGRQHIIASAEMRAAPVAGKQKLQQIIAEGSIKGP